MSDLASTALTPRHEDYSKWYHDVIRQADLAEPAEIVKGCMVIKPHGYAIWEKVQSDLDRRFKAMGVQNAYFPLLIPQSFLAREAEHIEGFSPELAVVTHAGGKALEEPYVIRPTSETIIGHFFARWIESHRDLPLRINQWANVVRWEMRTRMFLRTTEFLWQEGHTAHATAPESRAEAEKVLQCYRQFAREMLCVPVIYGEKTPNERFAGADTTWSIEAMMQDGKALQMGTSHDLGQNFGRAFQISFQTDSGDSSIPWQSSWGVSTRLLGGVIMTHSDDAGLVLPPSLAPIAVVIVPILGKHADAEILALAYRIKAALCDAGVATHVDDREYTPGFKFFAWEKKGVCLRIEIGPKDLVRGQVVLKSRLQTEKFSIPQEEVVERVPVFLAAFHEQLWAQAVKRLQAQTIWANDYAHFQAALAEEPGCFIMAHWDGTTETEQRIKEETKATIRVIPHRDSLAEYWSADEVAHSFTPGVCIKTQKPSAQRVLFAKAY